MAKKKGGGGGEFDQTLFVFFFFLYCILFPILHFSHFPFFTLASFSLSFWLDIYVGLNIGPFKFSTYNLIKSFKLENENKKNLQKGMSKPSTPKVGTNYSTRSSQYSCSLDNLIK